MEKTLSMMGRIVEKKGEKRQNRVARLARHIRRIYKKRADGVLVMECPFCRTEASHKFHPHTGKVTFPNNQYPLHILKLLSQFEVERKALQSTSSSSQLSPPCPICEERFPLDKIEAHADHCASLSSPARPSTRQRPVSRSPLITAWLIQNGKTSTASSSRAGPSCEPPRDVNKDTSTRTMKRPISPPPQPKKGNNKRSKK